MTMTKEAGERSERSATREWALRRFTLELLEAAEPYALTERQLGIELSLRFRPRVTAAELEGTVTFLASRGFVAVMEDTLDPHLAQWLITETGKALLRK
jgi:hypothetical protein